MNGFSFKHSCNCLIFVTTVSNTTENIFAVGTHFATVRFGEVFWSNRFTNNTCRVQFTNSGNNY